MERRILKDFQIGIVESISEAVQSQNVSAGDVFTTIAKAINKRTSNKQYVIHLMRLLSVVFSSHINFEFFHHIYK